MDNLFEAAPPTWLSRDECLLDSFREHVERTPDRSQYPNSAAIEGRIPIYQSSDIVAKLELARSDQKRACGMERGLGGRPRRLGLQTCLSGHRDCR